MKTQCLAVLSVAILSLALSLPAQEDTDAQRLKREAEGKAVKLLLEHLAKAEGAEQAAAEQGAEGAELVEIVMPDADLEHDLAPMYEELSRCKVVVHQSLSGRDVSVVAQRKMPVAEAVVFCETALLAAGIAIVETKPGTLILLPFGEVEGDLDYAPPVVTDRAKLPPGERVVDFVLPARGLDAEKVREFFTARLKPKPFTRFDAGPDGKSILVRETGSTVLRMLEMMDALETGAEAGEP